MFIRSSPWLVSQLRGLRGWTAPAEACPCADALAALSGGDASQAAPLTRRRAVALSVPTIALSVPTIALAGSLGKGVRQTSGHGVAAFVSVIKHPCTLKEAIVNGHTLLRSATEDAVRMVAVGQRALAA